MKIKFIIKNFPIKKTRSSDGFSSEFFFQTFMEEIVPILPQILSENITGGNTFQASITVIFKPDNCITKKRKTTDLVNIYVKSPYYDFTKSISTISYIG